MIRARNPSPAAAAGSRLAAGMGKAAATSPSAASPLLRELSCANAGRASPKDFSSEENLFLRKGYNRFKGNWTQILISYPFASARTAESLESQWRTMRDQTLDEAAPLRKRSKQILLANASEALEMCPSAHLSSPESHEDMVHKRDMALSQMHARHARILRLYDDSNDVNSMFDTPQSRASPASGENNPLVVNTPTIKALQDGCFSESSAASSVSPSSPIPFAYDFAQWEETNAGARQPLLPSSTESTPSLLSRIKALTKCPWRMFQAQPRAIKPIDTLTKLLQCETEVALQQVLVGLSTERIVPDHVMPEEMNIVNKLAGEFWDKWNARSGPIPSQARGAVLNIITASRALHPSV